MTKVYPNSANANIVPAYEPQRLNRSSGSDNEAVTVLTVWKKSLLLNCNGFTVFDSKGNLVFRVDNYLAGHKGEIVLMDAAGKPLLTIRRKRLSLGDNWVVYDGETTENPRFCATKHVNILKNKCLAHVTSANSRKGSDASKNYDNKNAVFYQMEGSYAQRCCAVYDSKRRRVAEIKRKEAVGGVALGVDVFRLIVQPDMDTSVAMSLVILLDQMYGTSRR